MSNEKDTSQTSADKQEHSLSKGESPLMDVEREGQRQPEVQQSTGTEVTSVIVKGTASEIVSQDPSQQDNSMQPEESKKDPNEMPLPTADKIPYVDYDPALIDKQNEEIRQEIEKDSPLISDRLPLDMLEFEFKDHEGFMKKIPSLKKTYPEYRKVRRDGSCFYRAFLFRLFEHLIKEKDEALTNKMIKFVQDSKEYLQLAGFELFVLEDFMDALANNLDLIKNGLMNEVLLIDTFRDKMTSDSLVMYMRFLTSGYLKTNHILYETFLENGITMDYFCQTEVEPIDKECDQIQIAALINYIQVPIRIIYLDANAKKEECDVILLPEDSNPKNVFITLLYRPGHYDILYT